MKKSVLTSASLFQDLQSEIDTERDNFLALTASSRKLLSSIESSAAAAAAAAAAAGGGGNEDAATLQRRLEEMNQRWNYLKAKSVAIRWVRAQTWRSHWLARRKGRHT